MAGKKGDRHPINVKVQPQFPVLIRKYLDRYGYSINQASIRTGVASSVISRLVNGQRDGVSRQVTLAMARVFRLEGSELDEFVMMSGHIPPSLAELDRWDESVAVTVDTLNSAYLNDAEKDVFRSQVIGAAQLARQIGRLRERSYRADP